MFIKIMQLDFRPKLLGLVTLTILHCARVCFTTRLPYFLAKKGRESYLY
jgi:hypothetical protein